MATAPTSYSHANIAQPQALVEMFSQTPIEASAELQGSDHGQDEKFGSIATPLALCRASQPFQVIVDSRGRRKNLIITELQFTLNLSDAKEWLSRAFNNDPEDVHIYAPFNANCHLVNMLYCAVMPFLPGLGCLHLQGPAECLSVVLGNSCASLRSLVKLDLSLQTQPRLFTPSAPRLQHVMLGVHAPLATLDPRLLCLPWTQLQSLDIEITSGTFYGAWDVLCACQNLIHLSIVATNATSDPDPPFKPDPHRKTIFGLHRLTLITNSRSAVVSDFLHAITLPELYYLNITFGGDNLTEPNMWPHRAIIDMWRWSATPLTELVLFGKIVSEDVLSDLIQEFRTLVKVSAEDDSTTYVTNNIRNILNERMFRFGLLQAR